MLDAVMRRVIDPPLNAVARHLVRRGVTADALTLAGVAASVATVVAIALGAYVAALAGLALSRLLDGLDGPVARCTTPTDRGGYLDSVCDYVFYAGVPFGFALAEPETNALPAAALLASFLLTGVTFLAFAALAAKRGVETAVRGRKSFFYAGGLVEGTETIALFVAMLAFPAWFPALAWAGAAACLLTAVFRTLEALRRFA
jgi:phosphatidylglycerophosphate synthase